MGSSGATNERTDHGLCAGLAGFDARTCYSRPVPSTPNLPGSRLTRCEALFLPSEGQARLAESREILSARGFVFLFLGMRSRVSPRKTYSAYGRMTVTSRASTQSKDNRMIGQSGKTKLGAILVLGIAGAAAGALVALISGFDFLGVAIGYVGGGLAATILAAVTLYFRERASGGP